MNNPATEPTHLDRLGNDWTAAKAEEDAAKAKRIKIEEEIAELIDAPESGEGSVTEDQNYYKVTASFGIQRNILADKIADLYGDDQAENALITLTFPTVRKLDLKHLRSIETVNPKLYKKMCIAIDSKPKKTAIKIAELKKK